MHEPVKFDFEQASLLDRHSDKIEKLFLNGSSLIMGHIGRRVHTLGKQFEKYNFTNAGEVLKNTGNGFHKLSKEVEKLAVQKIENLEENDVENRNFDGEDSVRYPVQFDYVYEPKEKCKHQQLIIAIKSNMYKVVF